MSIKTIDDIDLNKIIEFKKTCNAWLTKDGDLIPCQMYNHLEVLDKKYTEFKESRYSDISEETCRMLDQEYEVDSENFYPAYHRFDDMGEATKDTYREIYEDGYIRLGICRLSTKNDYLLDAFSSVINNLDSRKDFLVDLAKLLDVDMLYLTHEIGYTPKIVEIKIKR